MCDFLMVGAAVILWVVGFILMRLKNKQIEDGSKNVIWLKK